MTEPTGPTGPVGPPRRRTLGPVVLVAAASGALLAVAGNRPWRSVDGAPEPVEGAGQQVATPLDLAVLNPAVTALALVALAALGVVLVTRGRVRRLVAGLALTGAVGAAAAVVVAFVRTPGRVADEVANGPLAEAGTAWTTWAYAAVPAALLLLGACLVAVRDVRHWPEMGRRYDAPVTTATAPAAGTAPEDRSSLDLWKAMDEGRDPTDTDRD